jgi:hypothetical protein
LFNNLNDRFLYQYFSCTKCPLFLIKTDKKKLLKGFCPSV